MESQFNNRDVEQFVKQNADQYRMFPSEKVWTGIHTALHGRSRWYGIGLALLFFTAITVTWVMLAPNGRQGQLADKLPTSIKTTVALNETKQSEPVIISPVKTKAARTNTLPGAVYHEPNLFIAVATEEVAEEAVDARPVTATLSQPVSASLTIAQNNTRVTRQAAPEYVYTRATPSAKAVEPASVSTIPVIETHIDENNTEAPEVSKGVVAETAVTLTDPNLMTIESVVNSYIRIRKKNKFSLQAYFTPTISYRRLQENNAFIRTARSSGTPSTTTLAIADINSVVTHKPDIGLQLGVNGGYRLNDRFTFIAGVQFNINKYDIRVYTYPSEKATIALMSGTISPTTVEKETTYRNYSGSKNANWLHNLYFSASVPLGLELRLSGANKKTEIGVGGTIQPTYVLGNSTYLLSTDYRNYAEVPSLVREWNVSTGFEAYAGYSTGKINWRVGPQVRYQLLSSYSRKYPVKEHLFDFGIKIGIMLDK